MNYHHEYQKQALIAYINKLNGLLNMTCVAASQNTDLNTEPVKQAQFEAYKEWKKSMIPNRQEKTSLDFIKMIVPPGIIPHTQSQNFFK